jgi:hypothetical protein
MKQLLIVGCAGLLSFSACKPVQDRSDVSSAMPMGGAGDSIQLVTMPVDQGPAQLCAYLASGVRGTTYFIDTEVKPMLNQGVPSYQVLANLRNRIKKISVTSDTGLSDVEGSLTDGEVARAFGDVMNELKREEVGGIDRFGNDPLTSQIDVYVDPAAIELLKGIISDSQKTSSSRFVPVTCGTSKTQIALNHSRRVSKMADIRERRLRNCLQRMGKNDPLFPVLQRQSLIPTDLNGFCKRFADQRRDNLFGFAANEMCSSRGQGFAVAVEKGYICQPAAR